MNKFSKTSYPRHLNQNNFLLSVQQNKQKKTTIEQQQAVTKKHKIHDYDNSQFIHNLIDKKIQIESALLFSNKTQGRQPNYNNQKNKINVQGQRQLFSASTDGFYKTSKQRPESKRKSRVQRVQNLSLNKKKPQNAQRPQTSKGLRNVIFCDEVRKNTLESQCDNEIQITRTVKTGNYSKRKGTVKQLELQTSIDPQFLALFAS